MAYVASIFKTGHQKIQLAYKTEKEFYQTFHKNTINWYIHAITVPIEWFAWLLLLATVNCQHAVALVVTLYYINISSKASIPSASILVLGSFLADYTCSILGLSATVLVSIICQTIAWGMQVIIGHTLFEKNQPGFTKKLTLNSIVVSALLAWDWDNIHERRGCSDVCE